MILGGSKYGGGGGVRRCVRKGQRFSMRCDFCPAHDRVNIIICILKAEKSGNFLGGLVVKNPPSNAGDMGLIPIKELRSCMPRPNLAFMPQLLNPCTATKSSHAAAKTWHSQINK